jgi:hypothetical protein
VAPVTPASPARIPRPPTRYISERGRDLGVYWHDYAERFYQAHRAAFEAAGHDRATLLSMVRNASPADRCKLLRGA